MYVTCSFTYEVAPVFVLLEMEVLKSLRQLVGWTQGDGIFCPGGSASNMYAMNLARYRLFPDVKSQGLYGLPRLTVFTSSQVRNVCYTLHVWGIDDTVEIKTVSEVFIEGHTVVYVLFLRKYDWFLMFLQSHYSVKKGAAFLGIGIDNVIVVKVDDG